MHRKEQRRQIRPDVMATRFNKNIDRQFRPRIPAGRYSVAPNKVWLYGPNPRSWDSRYYGAQPVAGVLGTATPVLTLSR